MRCTHFVMWILMFAALPAETRAQAPLDEEALVRVVRERAPAMRALRAHASVADADIELAGVYPNPVLSYVAMGRFDGGNAAINGSQHQVWVEFPLLLAGQNHARRDAAASQALAAHAEVEVSLIALEMDARRAFVALLRAQERLERLRSAREELEQLNRVVEGRTQAGAQSDYDRIRVGLEVTRLDTELITAQAEVRGAQASIAALVGRPGWMPRAAGTLGLRAASYRARSDLPVVQAARRRSEAAERDVQRAQIERIPELRLGAGAYFTTDGDSSSAYVGLSMPLPVLDTGEAAVRRARAAQMAALEAEHAIELQAAARLEAAIALLDARHAALDRLDAGAPPQSGALRDMADASYRLGASGVFELIDAFRARVDLDLLRIDLVVEARYAELEVRALLGQ